MVIICEYYNIPYYQSLSIKKPAKSYGIFISSGWDFVAETENGTEDIWWILEGQDYPRLTWELVEGR